MATAMKRCRVCGKARGLADTNKKKERSKKYERSFAAEPVPMQMVDDVSVCDVADKAAEA